MVFVVFPTVVEHACVLSLTDLSSLRKFFSFIRKGCVGDGFVTALVDFNAMDPDEFIGFIWLTFEIC